MQFTISLKLVTVAILATALQANASNFVAFSGDTCNGAEGSVVSCNGDCGGFQNRHSFQVLNGNGNVVLFTNDDCTGESFNFGTEGSGECINVNVGTSVNSFVCS